MTCKLDNIICDERCTLIVSVWESEFKSATPSPQKCASCCSCVCCTFLVTCWETLDGKLKDYC